MPAFSRPVCNVAGILILIATAAACNDDLPTGSISLADCAAGAGTTHSGELSGSQTWTKENGPHRLVDIVSTSGTLSIEAGALVCGTPGSVLSPAVLRIEGTANSPVVLTATDSLVGWGGIRGGDAADSSGIRYANIRHAATGVRQTSGRTIVIESTTIFRSRGAALVGGIIARDVVIDSACAAASGTCSAVVASGYRTTTLLDPVIRDSRGGGIWVPERSSVNLTGGTISGSADVGITTQYSVRGSGGLLLHAPVRITGGDTVPVSLAELPALLLEREAQLNLSGNAIDEIQVHGSLSGEHEVYAEMPWRIRAACEMYGFAPIGTLRLEPGAAVIIESGCDAAGEIVGEGTAAAPISIGSNGVRLRAWDPYGRPMPDTVRLTHARITNTHITFEDAPGVLMDVELDGASLTFGAGGSLLTRAHVHDSPADGVIVAAADVMITDCTIENNAGHGVHVQSGEPRIAHCNLQNNGGDGVSNAGAGTVDARDNWWSDVVGPDGTEGDGVSGAVLHVPFLTSQVVW